MGYFLRKFYSLTAIRYAKIFSRFGMSAFISDAIRDHAVGAREILSIGSGGTISQKLRSSGIKFREGDIDPKRNPDLVLDIMSMSAIASGTIDCLFCLEVLEHVKNPFTAVEEIERVLSPRGVIVASTPFVFPIHDAPCDFFRFTKYGISLLFKNFDEVLIREKNTYIMSIYVLLVRLWCGGNIRQRLFGLILFPIAVLILPIFLTFNFVPFNAFSTTGYYYIYRKRSA